MGCIAIAHTQPVLVIGVTRGGALLYPSLLSLTLSLGEAHERPSRVGTFTMSFDAGQISGSLLLGVVAETFSLRASFGAAAAIGPTDRYPLLGAFRSRREHSAQ